MGLVYAYFPFCVICAQLRFPELRATTAAVPQYSKGNWDSSVIHCQNGCVYDIFIRDKKLLNYFVLYITVHFNGIILYIAELFTKIKMYCYCQAPLWRLFPRVMQWFAVYLISITVSLPGRQVNSPNFSRTRLAKCDANLESENWNQVGIEPFGGGRLRLTWFVKFPCVGNRNKFWKGNFSSLCVSDGSRGIQFR